jgi:hypothetical protein
MDGVKQRDELRLKTASYRMGGSCDTGGRCDANLPLSNSASTNEATVPSAMIDQRTSER